MITWSETVVLPDTTIFESMKKLDDISSQILLVANSNNVLLATVTDGDIRRALLAGRDLNDPIINIANRTPQTLDADTSPNDILQTIKSSHVNYLPLIDKSGQIFGLAGLQKPLSSDTPLPVSAVIMAGGEGRRLRPLTYNKPKPMIEIGGKPILEFIIGELVSHGITNIFLSVNYLSEMIKSHFGDGSKFGVNLTYLEEEKALGTAGALRLLPEEPTSPVIVMNGDVLTKIDFRSLISFHADSGADAVMAVHPFDIEIPYGVVTVNAGSLVDIQEKPKQSFLVNTGVYILGPNVFQNLPADETFHMTDLLQHMKTKQMPVNIFPLREYWLDIGRHDELERAQVDVEKYF